MSRFVADAIEIDRDAILEAWLERVSAGPKAAGRSRELLLNSMPELLDQMIAALRAPGPLRASLAINPEAAAEHGEQRLDLGYELEELGREYNHLRQVILEALDRRGVRLDNEISASLHSAIDQAHRAGVGRFIVAGQARLRQRQGEFLARVAHDLRSPLANIITSAQLAADATEAKRGAHLERVTRVAQRLLRMVERQLTTEEALAGELRPRLEAVSVKGMAAPLLDELRQVAASKGLELEDRIPDALEVQTDPALLGQVLQNLVDNAIKYTDRGWVLVAAEHRGDRLVLTVEDTGRGLPREPSAALFTMYQGAERGAPGHGVGLAVVRTIVEKLGGTISVRSAPGRGTRFDLAFPTRSYTEREMPAP